ncbi:MAG: GNAT family N-acetyltransferase [Marinobacter sp.]|uniref:GNAT family N-acetyltransferase n=1 Tax=Marinobacter sp. TaxID=50741 RepID=UPI00299EEEB3|nr:GNAT family N-acetyltransferase [Marinobacter sp.]MDX1634510.1 GNAT family N-acetyltransferase [Marinobacter sp.]
MKQVDWHPKYREGILRLLGDVPFKPAIWEWQFEQNPFGKPFTPVIFVDDNDRVVGFNGVMPILATDRGKPLDALWSCDFYIAPDWRGKKLGTHIKAALHQQANQVMAFGVSDKACDVLTHLGWKRYEDIHTYRLIRKRGSMRNWAFTGLQVLNRLLGVTEKVSGHFTLEVQSHLPAAQLVDELWDRSASGYGKVVTRNHAYLDWKYQRHPLARYAFVRAWRGETLAGVLVVRYHGGQLRIVDYCGPARDQLLKRSLIRACRKHWRHADQITAVTSDRELGTCLLQEGFFRPRSQPRFFIYTGDCSCLPSDAGWFVMAGDSDGELLAASADACEGRRPFSTSVENGGEPGWLRPDRESA